MIVNGGETYFKDEMDYQGETVEMDLKDFLDLLEKLEKREK